MPITPETGSLFHADSQIGDLTTEAIEELGPELAKEAATEVATDLAKEAL
jgi:hypothetical protein